MTNCEYCGRPVPDTLVQLHVTKHCTKAPRDEPAEVKQEASLTVEPNGDNNHETPTVEASGSLVIPSVDKHFLLDPKIREKLERICKMSQKHPVNVLVTGPQGSGKSSLAKLYAAKHGLPYLYINCGFMQEPSQWWGIRHFSKDRGTWYEPSPFVEALEQESVVVLLDEMNRVENPKVLNPLMTILNEKWEDRAIYLQELGRMVQVADRVVFFATLNEGFQFQGVDAVDAALRDRFHQIAMCYPPEDVEQKILTSKTRVSKSVAQMLVAFAQRIRNDPALSSDSFTVSTRQLLLTAEDIVYGASVRDAIRYTLAAAAPAETREPLTQAAQFACGEDIWGEPAEGWEAWI